MFWLSLNFEQELKRRMRYCKHYNPLTLLNAMGSNGPMRRSTDSCKCEANVAYKEVGATLLSMPCIDGSKDGTCPKWSPRPMNVVLKKLNSLKNVKGEKDVTDDCSQGA